MEFEPLDIPGGDRQMTARYHGPAGKARAGLVVIAYGSDGFVDNDHGPWKTMIEGYAEDLAGRGLFALIPDYFARTATPREKAAMLIPEHQDKWAAALVDTVAHARTLPEVDDTKIGLLGFSLGGYLCLRIRAAAKPSALVEYFAPAFAGIGPAGSVPHIQIHHGTHDQGPTAFANATAIEAALKKESRDVTLFPYEGATHGFSGADAANTNAATTSRQRTVDFFAQHL